MNNKLVTNVVHYQIHKHVMSAQACHRKYRVERHKVIEAHNYTQERVLPFPLKDVIDWMGLFLVLVYSCYP